MKKSSLYFLIPVIALIVFGAIFWNFSSGYEAKEAAKALKIRQDREAKLLIQAKANEEAIKQANAGVAARKAEREAKEAKDKQDKEARQTAMENRDKAYTDRDKFAKQVTRLETDIKTEQDAIAKLQEEKKKSTDELAFLRTYTRQADDNVKSLQAVLDRIAAADAARAAAEAAAAAAAKKNS